MIQGRRSCAPRVVRKAMGLALPRPVLLVQPERSVIRRYAADGVLVNEDVPLDFHKD
jgi:hypothetical protein